MPQSSKELLHYRVRNVWLSHKHCKFCTFIEKVDFDAVVDDLAITHIMKSKMESATNRIKRLLEDIKLIFLQFVLYKRKRTWF